METDWILQLITTKLFTKINNNYFREVLEQNHHTFQVLFRYFSSTFFLIYSCIFILWNFNKEKRTTARYFSVAVIFMGRRCSLNGWDTFT